MTAALNLESIHLDKGQHSDPTDGHCLLEVVSMLAKEPFTDHPQCVSPVLAAFGIGLNDQWDDEKRQLLKQFIPLLPGTRDDGQDEARGYLALDWLIRTFTPAWLDLAGLAVEAQGLRGLRRIVDSAAWSSMEVEAEAKISAAYWAAYSAAYWAAYWAACSAADSALEPTVALLQASAIELYHAMINPDGATR
jgi:hypothetical protein